MHSTITVSEPQGGRRMSQRTGWVFLSRIDPPLILRRCLFWTEEALAP